MAKRRFFNRFRPPRMPQVLALSEQTSLIRHIPGARDRLLVRLMLATGLRASEAVSLHLRNLDAEEGSLKIFGKGGYIRIVWMPSPVLRSLRGIFRQAQDGGPIFRTRSGAQLSTSYLRQLLALAGHRAGILRRVHPHMLRHTFATELYRETHDIRLVQRALGHAHIGTTEIYTYVSELDVRDAMRRPRNSRTVI